MTVALAYVDPESKHAYIAADSCASNSIDRSIVKNCKVFNPVGRRDVLIGCAGTFRLPNLLQYVPGIFPAEDELATDDINLSYLINEFTPVVRALTDDFDDDDAWELLIAVKDRIYRMQMDLSIIEPADNVDSIGIGGSVALGAMKVLNELAPYMPVEQRLKHALQVACSSIQGCCAPFLIRETVPVPDEILAKIPKDKEREKRGYEIIRYNDEDIDKDESSEITLSLDDIKNISNNVNNTHSKKKSKKELLKYKKKKDKDK